MSQIDPQPIRARILEIARREADLSEEIARDVAFHKTDWLNDLAAFNQFCTNPSAMSDPEVNRLLIQFLAHAPNHLAAASKLYTDIPVTDVFGVGATSEEDRNVS